MHRVWVLIICMMNKFPGDGGEGAMLGVTGGRKKHTGLLQFQDCDGFPGEKGSDLPGLSVLWCLQNVLISPSLAFPGSRQGSVASH